MNEDIRRELMAVHERLNTMERTLAARAEGVRLSQEEGIRAAGTDLTDAEIRLLELEHRVAALEGRE